MIWLTGIHCNNSGNNSASVSPQYPLGWKLSIKISPKTAARRERRLLVFFITACSYHSHNSPFSLPDPLRDRPTVLPIQTLKLADAAVHASPSLCSLSSTLSNPVKTITPLFSTLNIPVLHPSTPLSKGYCWCPHCEKQGTGREKR